MLDREIENVTDLRDALVIEDVELDFLERRSNFVLDDLRADAVADDIGTVLENFFATHVDAHRGIELQCITTSRRLGITIDHTDLRTKLIGEHYDRIRLADRRVELAHCLRHESGL